MVNGKKILLAVCGSIAAYKAAYLIRLLVKSGAEVKVVMTDAAKAFITPLTLATLAKSPVYSRFEKNEEGEWNNHVSIGLWADLMLVAPASANTLGKCANGLCDNLLSAVYLSARCPVVFAPAMDLDMYQHPSVKHNIKKLSEYGNLILDAEYGDLASGLTGQGRMMEPEGIMAFLEQYFQAKSQPLKGKKAIVSAGPTHEAIDPVRFIGNHSSGKMGHAMAQELTNAGCKVTLVSGPVSNGQARYPYEVKKVVSADEMYDAINNVYPQVDIAVFAAAVADYRPAKVAPQKIKKKDEEAMVLKLVKNKDIALEMGKIKKKQVNIGFALETENELENAGKKLEKKNFDLIVLNSLNDAGAGFAHDTNKVTILDKDNNSINFGLKSKKEVAKDVVNEIVKIINR